MNTFGFYIRELKLVGPTKADAIVQFGVGLNVISGPSDTGKTFIAECIDYAFGSSGAPSDIPEAQGYDTVVLGITSLGTGVEYEIHRSLRGGGARVITSGQADRILAEKHDPDNPETLSYFFLSLSGLAGKMVRMNAQGKTRQISFRDLAQLFVVSELEIIRKISPVRSGQNTDRTVEDSVFRLVLSGTDDASVVAGPERALVAAETRGKEGLLRLLLDQARLRLAEIAPNSLVKELTSQLEKLSADIDASTSLLASERQAATAMEERRRSAWTSLRESQSRQTVLAELQERFNLLTTQYDADLSRLESIAEAGVRLGQLDEARCPVCGAEAKHHATTHPEHIVTPGAVAEACTAEAARLRILRADLARTIDDNEVELSKLVASIASLKQGVADADRELAAYFRPRLSDVVSYLRDARETQATVKLALEAHGRVAELETLQAEVEKRATPTPKSKFVTAPGTSSTEEFSLKVEDLLRTWEFPNLQRVTFNEAGPDLVISGRKRADHGKGVRAIMHAAFTIGLMHYCVDKRMPHPSIVIIDSPLLVYRDPDPEETGFSLSLKDLVYTSLASETHRGQIILLENEDPPASISANATIIRFTGAAHGRRGFIPDPEPQDEVEAEPEPM